MQSLEAKSQYRNSFHCGYRIFTEEGVLRFWTGTTPRLVRLVVSSCRRFTRCLLKLFLVAIGWDRLHRVRKGDRRYRWSILTANRRCIILHHILLWLKPPDLHSIIPDLAHALSRQPRSCALIPAPPPSNTPLAQSTICVLHDQRHPYLLAFDSAVSFPRTVSSHRAYCGGRLLSDPDRELPCYSQPRFPA